MSRFVATIRGRQHEWSVYVAEASVEDMREDGIEVLEIVNTIPAWVVDAGFARIWCLMQDIWDAPSRLWRKIKRKQ